MLLVDIIYIKSTTKTSFQTLAATTKSKTKKQKVIRRNTGKREKKRKLKIVHASENKE